MSAYQVPMTPTSSQDSASSPADSSGTEGDSSSEPPSSDGQPATTDAAPEGPEISLHLDDDLGPEQIARWSPLQETFIANLASVLCQLGVSQGQLSIAWVNDQVMARLHQEFSGVEGTTDVLTFDLRDDDDAAALDGEIICCVDEAVRQAALRRHSPEQELLLYAVHGLLHLLGEDDHDEDDARQMHAREDELLGRLGIGPVYARPTIADPPGSA